MARKRTIKPKRTAAYRRRERTAYHEAGHAVIGRVLTLPCQEATIRPDYAERMAGYSHTPEPYACLHAWEERGKVRDSNTAVWHARIITLMAGAEAEAECLGSQVVGDGDDRYWIGIMLEEVADDATWEGRESRLRG